MPRGWKSRADLEGQLVIVSLVRAAEAEREGVE